MFTSPFATLHISPWIGAFFLLWTLWPTPDGPPMPTPDAPPLAAAGQGLPWMNYTDGQYLSTQWTGPAAAQHPAATPRTLATGDFNEDGVPDLVSGYALPTGGLVGVRRGNLDALYPHEAGAQARKAAGTFTTDAFLPMGQMFATGLAPDFMESGDFDADGHLDLVLGSRTEPVLHWLPGRGDGTFKPPQTVPLPGPVTALTAGEINRPDGLADLAVGTLPPQIQVFEGPEGALRHPPEVLPLKAPATAVLLGRLDAAPGQDLAVGVASELILVQGRDRRLSAPGARVAPPPRRVFPLPEPVVALAAGRFIGNGRTDLALVSANGGTLLWDGDTGGLHALPYRVDASQATRPPMLVRAKVSSLPTDEVVMLDRVQGQIHILNATHFAAAVPQPSAFYPEGIPLPLPAPPPVTLDVAASPVALQMMRLNGDALADLVVLTPPQAPGQDLVVARTAPVQEFVVDTDAGFVNAGDRMQGDGVCESFVGGCTLAAAIEEANAIAGPDQITFAIGTITSDGWAGPIRETVTIDGSGQGRVVLQGSDQLSIFPDAVAVTVRGLAVNGTIQLNGGADAGGGNLVEGNFVGIDGDGLNPARENQSNGIDALSVGNIIGGTTAAARNVTQDIVVRESDNLVQGNYVGVNAPGTGGIDRSFGILVSNTNNNIQNVVIGGTDPNAGNVVAGRQGIFISRVPGPVRIQGNRIGTDAGGTVGLGLVSSGPQHGVELQLAAHVTVGGTTPVARNIIAAASGLGIRLSVADSAVVQGNYIGTDVTGRDSLANGLHGIEVFNSAGVFIGGTTAGAGNVIAGNRGAGIHLNQDVPIALHNNLIGTDVSGQRALGNGGNGLLVDGSQLTIGGAGVQEGNVISGNGLNGVFFTFADQNRLLGNHIGTDVTGTVALGNGGHGVAFSSTSEANVIGGTEAGEGNTIAFNLGDGIFVDSNMRQTDTWFGNAIYENGGLGINLDGGNRDEDTGVTPNDDGDRDTSAPNNLQNFPVLTLNADGTLHTTFNSEPNLNYRIEYFGNPACDASGHGEGQVFLAAEAIATDADGNYAGDPSVGVVFGEQFVTAIAIAEDGDASEFAACAELAVPLPLIVQVLQDSLQHTPQPVAHTAFEIGKVDFSDPANPFTLVDTQVSDARGLLFLDPNTFAEGEAFHVRTFPHQEPAAKGGHADVDGIMYVVEVDNLLSDTQGILRPDTLAADTTRTYLGHTAIGFNMVISIEWPATAAYVESLVQALRSANNYFFDVANGQAYFKKIAIYDDKQKWDEADLRLYAANTQWPQAGVNGIRNTEDQMHFPPQHFGFGEEENVDYSFTRFPLDLNVYRNFSTFIHEFGHYGLAFFDEYEDKEGNLLPRNQHFGYMDKQMREGEAASSEMSAFVTQAYRQTRQFDVLGVPCWEFFRTKFRDTYGNVRAEIHTPRRLGLAEQQRIPGPNDNLDAPDYDVGRRLEVVRHTSSNAPEPLEYLVVDGAGRPIPGVRVELDNPETGRNTQQGKTVIGVDQREAAADKGKIRLRGAREGDQLNISTTTGNGDWQYVSTPVITSPGKADPVIVALRRLNGTLTQLSEVTFDGNGQLTYQTQFDRLLGAPPALRIAQDGAAPEDRTLAGAGPDYSTPLPGPLAADALLRLTAPDSLGEAFFVSQFLSVFTPEPGATLRPGQDNLELMLDTTAQAPAQVAVLSSNFPPPTAGLPQGVRRVSPVYAVHGTPLAPVGALKLYYTADSLLASVPEAVTIFRWAGQWVPLPTVVNIDPRFQSATAALSEGGLYAAYLDLARTTMVATTPDVPRSGPQGVQLQANYPNPFTTETTLSYTLPHPTRVRLQVFNVLGQVVATVAEGVQPAGPHTARFEGRGLPPGLYVVQLEAAGRRTAQTIIKAQ